MLGRVSEASGQSSLVADIEVLLGVLGVHCAHLMEWTLRYRIQIIGDYLLVHRSLVTVLGQDVSHMTLKRKI